MLSLLMLLAAQDASDLMANARKRTGIERCQRRVDDTDITVCGLRDADRFRVPFIVHDPGDVRYQSVAAEREKLIHRPTPIDELGPFLVGGGMAGLSASTQNGVTGATNRKLAP